uniref:Uncharacterized protein n=1 Tax=Anguilla anguilla TaxID=7936 RepID=A0A0E9UWN5_ANGAN
MTLDIVRVLGSMAGEYPAITLSIVLLFIANVLCDWWSSSLVSQKKWTCRPVYP